MPGPNWIKSIIKRGKKYIKPIAEKFSLTEDTAKKALIEAQQYKQSEGYKDLLQRSIQEGKQMGLIFSEPVFIGTEKPMPEIKIMDLSDGVLGSYKYATNTLKLDPKQLVGKEVLGTPLHESIHWQRIGIPEIITPKYQKWATAFDQGLPKSETDKLWGAFFADPYELNMLKIRDAASTYLNKKASNVTYDTVHPYLIKEGELQAHGIEAGRMLGLNYFEPYPGYTNAKDAIRAAQQYNSYLKDIRSNTDKDAQNFWKILTGNYLPSIGKVGEGRLPNELLEDIKLGKRAASTFFDSPVVRQSYLHNQELAKRLGIKLQDRPSNMAQIVARPINLKWVPYSNDEIASIAQSGLNDPLAELRFAWTRMSPEIARGSALHEGLHLGYYGAPIRTTSMDINTYNNEYVPAYNYWKWKTSHLVKPEYMEGYLGDIHGGEAGVNLIEVGKQMGLKLGQKYPGDAKMIELLNTQWPEYKMNLLPQLQTDTRAGRRHIWQALTGQFYGLGPIIGGIRLGTGLNKSKQEDNDTGMNL